MDLRFVVGGKQLRLVDIANGRTVWSKSANAVEVSGGYPSLTPDDARVIVGTKGGSYLVLDKQNGQVVGKFGAGDDLTEARLAVSPDGQLVATANSQSLAIWDLSHGQQGARIGNDLDFSDNVAATPDLSTAVLGASDKSIAVFDLKNGQLNLRLTGHKLSVPNVRISRDGKLAASMDSDLDRGRTEILWWDLETGRQLRTIDVAFPQADLALLADGHRAIFIDHDGVLKLWDLDRGVPPPFVSAAVWRKPLRRPLLHIAERPLADRRRESERRANPDHQSLRHRQRQGRANPER